MGLFCIMNTNISITGSNKEIRTGKHKTVITTKFTFKLVLKGHNKDQDAPAYGFIGPFIRPLF